MRCLRLIVWIPPTSFCFSPTPSHIDLFQRLQQKPSGWESPAVRRQLTVHTLHSIRRLQNQEKEKKKSSFACKVSFVGKKKKKSQKQQEETRFWLIGNEKGMIGGLGKCKTIHNTAKELNNCDNFRSLPNYSSEKKTDWFLWIAHETTSISHTGQALLWSTLPITLVVLQVLVVLNYWRVQPALWSCRDAQRKHFLI